MLISLSAWPPSQLTCLRCFLLVFMTPNMWQSLSSDWWLPIWSTLIRNGEYCFVKGYFLCNLLESLLVIFLCFFFCSKLDNNRCVTSGSTGPHVHVEFCQYSGHMSTYVDYRECPALTSTEGQSDICQCFSVSFTLEFHSKLAQCHLGLGFVHFF